MPPVCCGLQNTYTLAGHSGLVPIPTNQTKAAMSLGGIEIDTLVYPFSATVNEANPNDS